MNYTYACQQKKLIVVLHARSNYFLWLMSSVVNVQNVVECLNMIMIMMMNSYKKKIGEEFFSLRTL